MLNKNSVNPYANTPGRLARAANAGRSDYYIYVVVRHTGEVVYVGKGRGKRAFRDFTRGGENFHLRAIFKKDREAGLPEPKSGVVREGLTEPQAYELEMSLIAEHKRTCDGGTLTNMTAGGPGGEPGTEALRLERVFLKCMAQSANNRGRTPALSFEDCIKETTLNPSQLRREILRQLFVGPATLQELSDRIGTTPPLGPNKGGRPATPEIIGAAMCRVISHLAKRTNFRVALSADGVFSVVLAGDENSNQERINC
jgi:hypothetical protein